MYLSISIILSISGAILASISVLTPIINTFRKKIAEKSAISKMRKEEIEDLYKTLEKIKYIDYENKEEKLKELYELKVRFNKVLIEMTKEDHIIKNIRESVNQPSQIGAEKYLEKLINKALITKND